jgi:hypothetical protein
VAKGSFRQICAGRLSRRLDVAGIGLAVADRARLRHRLPRPSMIKNEPSTRDRAGRQLSGNGQHSARPAVEALTGVADATGESRWHRCALGTSNVSPNFARDDRSRVPGHDDRGGDRSAGAAVLLGHSAVRSRRPCVAVRGGPAPALLPRARPPTARSAIRRRRDRRDRRLSRQCPGRPST